jgi:hypothetical protein
MDPHRPKVVTDQDLASLHPRFMWMRDYLDRVAPPGRLPGRQHIDPLDVKDLLPLVNLIEVTKDSKAVRFRFRLVGTVQTEMAGRDITGMFVEDAVLPAYVNRILSNMRTAAERKRPVYDRFPMPHPNREFIDSERVYFPLAADGETVDTLFLVHAYPNRENKEEPG